MTVLNLREVELQEDPRVHEGHRILRAMLGQAVGATHTGFSVYELPPGQKAWAYHYELSREEWLFVIDGDIVVRTPEGDRPMRAGDVTCFPPGEAGAHQVRNDSEAAARFAMPSSWDEVVVAVRPDSNSVLINSGGFRRIIPLDDELDYWEREP